MPLLHRGPRDLVSMHAGYAIGCSSFSPILRGASLHQGLELTGPSRLPKSPVARLCVQNRRQSLCLEAFKACQGLKQEAAFKNQNRTSDLKARSTKDLKYNRLCFTALHNFLFPRGHHFYLFD